MSRFLSPESEVFLVNSFARPFDNAVAAARTCYSSKGIITPEEVAGELAKDEEERERRRQRRNILAEDIFKAGHHTVFQHGTVQFALSNVSRQFVWSFLHSHPWYNSEQVSQRYVEVKAGNYLIPPLQGEALRVYENTVQKQFDAYHALIETLQPLASRAFYQVFPARQKQSEKWQGDIKKRAMEIARYVLPVATFTYLYHTVNCVTLLRYWRLCQMWDAPLEQRTVVEKMVGELLKVSPEYERLLGEPIPLEETIEFQFYESLTPSPQVHKSFRDEFDASLNGCISKLADCKPNNETLLAQSVREVLGVPASVLSDDDAIALAIDPARNWYLGETLNLTAHSKLTRAMAHPHYTFRKKLSHTADSQDQRHRTTPASRPVLIYHLSDEPDFITPDLVRHDERATKIYHDIMDATWDGINHLRRLGVSAEFAAYLLPNAVAVRFTESADLAALWHKHAMRLCYNAQEEIWRASVEEAMQIRAVNPRIGRFLLPPCGLRERAQLTPYCPEGKRYCGVRVWKLDVENYKRVI
jgi:flavin-dependent thymidylate synthase